MSNNLVEGKYIVRVEPWLAYDWLVQGYSLAGAGNISYQFGSEKAVNKARERINSEIGMPGTVWSGMQQIHGSDVVVTPAAGEVDGIITDNPDELLTVLVADCVPLLMIDPKTKRVAAVHAGRRGTFARIAEQAVAAMVGCGSEVGDIEVAIGPSIGPCCYVFDGQPLDLWSLNEKQLREAGVKTVIRTDFCTKHTNGVFFSHQNDPGAGRFAGVIAVKAD